MALLSPVTANFLPHGQLVSDETIERGHINRTYMTVVQEGTVTRRYIHQHINSRVFPNPVAMMGNIRLVLDHIKAKRPDCTSRLDLVPADDGLDYYVDEEGQFWRCYRYIEDSTSFDVVPNNDIAYQAALAFGSFLADLSDFPHQNLHVTIENFHNTNFRLEQFDRARQFGGLKDRLALANAEIEFIDSQRVLGGMLMEVIEQYPQAIRATHNDTKVNNVLFSSRDLTPLTVIDLDTVMPGIALFDIGDLIRTACTTAAEDESDLTRVKFDMARFDSIIKGFAETVGSSLHPAEWNAMPYCGAVITLTIGIRFLTDYLSGDTYFRTHREHHNLDRARTQIELVRQQLAQIDELSQIVAKHRLSVS